MKNKNTIEQTINNGIELLESFRYLNITQSLEQKTKPDFSLKNSTIKCFIGNLGKDGKKMPVLGCTQFYYLANIQSEKTIFLSSILNSFHKNGTGLKFTKKTAKEINNKAFTDKEEDNKPFSISHFLDKYEWVNFKIDILSFYQCLSIPLYLKRYFSKKFPMSVSVVLSDRLNIPINQGVSDKEENFCYSFINEKHIPSIWGFGPGKFEKAIKHYSVSVYNQDLLRICLTSLITPRSEKILNIRGFDPVYSVLKLVDLLTMRVFKIYEKTKNKIELMMMKHHAKIHEEMLSILFSTR